ncbi:YwqJ-related putative deaminase [Granulosicoccus antarcticus]|uniref:Uncharacterized protein n=1 Tax=Granulosicoccus antarcticus IMCC3135 TaxID=1192854 RepID=A0A2Z2P1E8_9GAMM|nr:YwqJ-related putative deaminase [Granulosicoccus antarcticus]ASJ76625.1 hypothetical protein IMCC3135_32905 [Granulosicoccus antarcticus IMCC3135]
MDVSGTGRSSSPSSSSGNSYSDSSGSGSDWSSSGSGLDTDNSTFATNDDSRNSRSSDWDTDNSSTSTTDTLRNQTTELDRARGEHQAPTVQSAADSQPQAIAKPEPEISFSDVEVGSVVAGVIGSNNGIFASSEIRTRNASSTFNDQIVADGLGNKSVVSAAVFDNVTGKITTGTNSKAPLSRESAHPVLQQRLDNMDYSRAHNSWQGNHAEVHALNDALWSRETHNQSTGTPRAVTEADLPSMTLQTAWTKSSQKGGMTIGEVAHRCANCTQLTDGVQNLAGDSPADYSVSKAAANDVSVATDTPRYAFANSDLSSARRGAQTGALAGFGISSFQNLRDGVTTEDVATIATDTGVAAATGATGEMIENSVARFVESRAGAALQQGAGTTTRVMSSRIAGAGVAGAVIGAGFSSVDQVQAWQRGEVSGSEAIGTVTAEAATGLAAGSAGALAGAAIGSIIPVAGTVVGGVVGFGVGMAAGWAADKGLRASGITDAVASGVTTTIDAGGRAVEAAGDAIGSAASAVSDTVERWGQSLSSAFGW